MGIDSDHKDDMEKVWKRIQQFRPQEGRVGLRISELAEEMQAECGMKPLETGICVGMLRKMGFVKIRYAEYAPNKIADDFISVVDKKRDANIRNGGYRKKSGLLGVFRFDSVLGETGLLGAGWKK